MDNENQQTPTAEKRCVIYCRKSSSDGLDRDYTSIDCQTDTCKAYIERHAGEGWRFTGRVYADGGFAPAVDQLIFTVTCPRYGSTIGRPA